VAGLPATIVPGPPALAVLLDQHGVFGEPADLVIAGINAGANCGRSLIHSGTVGAALAAVARGTAGVALSLAPPERDGAEYQWATARAIAAAAATLAAQPSARGYAVNVNVPDLPLAEVRGWRHTTVATDGMSRLFARPVRAGAVVEFSYGLWPTPFPPDTDSGAVHDGYVSVTWLGSVYSAAEVPPVASVAAFANALDQTLPRPAVTS
jgi:5'-nucleotidase